MRSAGGLTQQSLPPGSRSGFACAQHPPRSGVIKGPNEVPTSSVRTSQVGPEGSTDTLPTLRTWARACRSPANRNAESPATRLDRLPDADSHSQGQ